MSSADQLGAPTEVTLSGCRSAPTCNGSRPRSASTCARTRITSRCRSCAAIDRSLPTTSPSWSACSPNPVRETSPNSSAPPSRPRGSRVVHPRPRRPRSGRSHRCALVVHRRPGAEREPARLRQPDHQVLDRAGRDGRRPSVMTHPSPTTPRPVPEALFSGADIDALVECSARSARLRPPAWRHEVTRSTAIAPPKSVGDVGYHPGSEVECAGGRPRSCVSGTTPPP